jgi:methyl-accepting chemotaxis protein
MHRFVAYKFSAAVDSRKRWNQLLHTRSEPLITPMNRIRTYLGRIQGRLAVAFLFGFFGMAAIAFLSMARLGGFTGQIADRVEQLGARGNYALNLDAAISDQVSAAQEYLATGDDQARLAADSLARHARQIHDTYRRTPGVSAEVLEQLGSISEKHAQLGAVIQGAESDFVAGRPVNVSGRIQEIDRMVLELRARIRALNTLELSNVGDQAAAIQASAADMQRVLLTVLFAATIVATIFGYLTMKAIERPLNRLVVAANQFGEGDLNVSVNGRMPDEFRVLAGAFTGMADRFRVIVGETVRTANTISQSASDLSSISEQVAASSGEVSTAMIGITTGAEEQAFGLRTADQALDRMRDGAAQIEEAARRVVNLSAHIGELAERKQQDIRRALTTLLELREVVQSSNREVVTLVQASHRISDFVGTIQGIARQTNLLALNAAIEAARAGEHGRGFAVVADEVRKLADASARASGEVATTVKQIRQQIDAYVATMESGFTRVAGVEETSKGAEAAFEEILSAVSQVRDAAGRVAQAADANRLAFETVDEQMRNVGAAAESHAASAQEVSAAAEEQSAATEEMSAASVELLMAADRLKELVSGFRV